MNKIKIFLVILVSNSLFSQNDIAKISYKISINKKNFEKNDTIVSENSKEILNHFKSILKNAIEKKYDLFYKDSISLFVEKSELDNNTINSNLYSKSSNDKLFININKKTFVNQIEFYGKNFSIIDTLNNFKWEISKNETKTILNKKVYKATCVVKKNQKENKITAWFSDDIKCAFGPDLYYGLPGLILQLDTGDLTYTCQEINISNDVTIKKPNSGKKVSQKEFDLISQQKQMEIKIMGY